MHGFTLNESKTKLKGKMVRDYKSRWRLESEEFIVFLAGKLDFALWAPACHGKPVGKKQRKQDLSFIKLLKFVMCILSTREWILHM